MPLSLTQVGKFRCFEGAFSFSTTNTGATDYVIIPPDVDRISVQLKVSSTASATVEVTCGTRADILAGTADWLAWTNGAVTGGTISQDATRGPVSAVRLNVGTAKAGIQAYLNILCQRGTP